MEKSKSNELVSQEVLDKKAKWNEYMRKRYHEKKIPKEKIVKERNKEKYNQYMKEYMKNRYNNKKEKMELYNRSLICKNKNNVTIEEIDRNRIYLADVSKLKNILENLPDDLVKNFLNNYEV
jgi:hypothetical protein